MTLRTVADLTATLTTTSFQPDKIALTTYKDYILEYAQDAVVSEADMALWTNRVPAHEPWGRQLKCQPRRDPNADQPYDFVGNLDYNDMSPQQRQDVNRHHDNHLPDESAWVGKIDGSDTIKRNPLWRR